jgi:hypothetical protein
MRASDWRDEVSEQLPDDGATHGGQQTVKEPSLDGHADVCKMVQKRHSQCRK